MGITAGQIESIGGGFNAANKGVRGVDGENPFGSMAGSDGIAGAVGSFTAGMQGELEAAERLMAETGSALRRAAQLHSETDDAAKDSVTVKNPTDAQA